MALMTGCVAKTGKNKAEKEKLIEEGLKYWKQRNEEQRRNKLLEQKEAREMLEKYWPWGNETKPRRIGDVKLEGLYPIEDYQKVNRFMDTMIYGGGGAPRVSKSGRKFIRFHEDPNLRFQWTKELRKHVDDRIRYKNIKQEQENYKKELDKLVEEKKERRAREMKEETEEERRQFLRTPPWGKPGPGGTLWRSPGTIGLDFLKSLGWSNAKTLEALDKEREQYRQEIKKGFNKFKNVHLKPPNQIEKIEEEDEELHEIENSELVPVLAKRRALPKKVPLTSTDVTKESYTSTQRSDYLKELSNQIKYRFIKLKEGQQEEMKTTRQHFATWESYWGRPGHGAPTSFIRKRKLDKMLYYPKLVATNV